MLFQDHLTLDAPRRTRDGYLAVRARSARTGVYEYSGREVDPTNAHGLRDQAVVRVLRDENTVFDSSSAQSFIGKPVTDDHPRTAVTASNWRDHARGTIMGALRDGDYLAFDLLLTDAEAIAKVDAGKRELSNGYDANLEFGDFRDAQGGACQARQTRISGNHIALVDRGRAGPECRIADTAICDSLPRSFLDSLTVDGTAAAIGWLEKAIALHRKHMSGKAPTTGEAGEKSQQLMMEQMENALSELKPSANKTMKMDQLNTQEKPVKTMLIDGLTVDVANPETASATITTILAARDAAASKVATLETEKATLAKQLADATMTPEKLRDAAKSYALVVGKAKALGVAVTDAMDEPAIMSAVVTAKMGDTAKGWNADQIAASFAVLAKDAKVDDAGRDVLRDALIATPVNVGDERAAYEADRAKRRAALSDAWRQPAGEA